MHSPSVKQAVAKVEERGAARQTPAKGTKGPEPSACVGFIVISYYFELTLCDL